MAQHEVYLDLPEVSISNADASFNVYSDGDLLGKIKVSKGTIEWQPSSHTEGYHMNWEDFDELMKEKGFKR